jgi:Fur family ferric uptake transcriptional regulator
VAEHRGFKIQDHSLHLYAQCMREDCPHRQRAHAA